MFNDMIQPHIDRLRPLAQSAADEARAYGERVIARLDALIDANQGDSTIYYRERPTIGLTAGTPDTDSIKVPGGERWLLEAVTIVPTGAVGTPGSVVVGVSDGLPMYAAPHTGRPTTVGGNGVWFESGTSIRVTANEVNALVAFQFRVERHAPEYVNKGAGGVQELRPDGTTPGVDDARHTGTWQPDRTQVGAPQSY